MRKLIVLFVLLCTLPTFGDDNHQRQPRSPEDEWTYWQNHYDELDAAAADDSASGTSKTDRGISAEIEGCRTCQQVDKWQEVYCNTYLLPDQTTTTTCSFDSTLCVGNCVGTNDGWVQVENGQKCTLSASNTYVAMLITPTHGPSASMWAFLNGVYGIDGMLQFTPYYWTLDGTFAFGWPTMPNSCSSSDRKRLINLFWSAR